MQIKYQCKYCGKTVTKGYGVPLKTKCPRRPAGGTHCWVIIKKLGSEK